MRALSLRQPWANLIASGKKTIETRKWTTHYRGPLLIVSSKVPRIEPFGCAVVLVNLESIRVMTKEDEIAACCEVYPKAQSWVLTDPRRVRPIPVKGSLGLFDCGLELSDLEFI